VTKENAVIVVPGKVLGTGNVSHKITLSSFSISNSAAKKIIESGGTIISFSEMINKFPTGKGVIIIG
ncbi:MAG: uL15 family ribosomal protein, partial [Nitrosopumilus sp.]